MRAPMGGRMPAQGGHLCLPSWVSAGDPLPPKLAVGAVVYAVASMV